MELKEQIQQKIKTHKEALEILREEKHIAFIKGAILGLQVALETIEKGEKNENKKI